jgi:hypothetical protein
METRDVRSGDAPRCITLTKEEFQGFAACLKYPGRITFSLYRGENLTLTLDEFCQALGKHDPELAAKVHAWHTAAAAMFLHINERFEGFAPDPTVVNAGGHAF